MTLKGFPRGHKALVQEGYEFLFAATCREPDCGAAVHWYKTPHGRRMPTDVARRIPHFICCKAVESERAERRREAAEVASRQFELSPGNSSARWRTGFRSSETDGRGS